MAETAPFSHVGQFVLLNADKKFAKIKASGKNKNGTYKTHKDAKGREHQQGRDFYEIKDGNGDRTQFGYKTGFNVNDDGPLPDDFTGNRGWPHDDTTAFQWDDGQSVSGASTNYVTLPERGGAFGDVKPGDYVLLTNSQNGNQVGAIVADTGHANQAGEFSLHATQDLGVDTKGGATGMNMTDSKFIQMDWFPNSGQRTGNQIKKQTNEEITKNAKAVAEARSVKGGVVIVAAKNSVLIGKLRMPAACADPAVIHAGGCPMATGSDSVSVELCPATRVGDACSCNRKVVSGEESVQVGGACTAAKETPPSKNLYTPPSLSKYPQTGTQTVPSWAQGLLGPQQPQPSMINMANQHFQANPSAWPAP